jgi:hypothetical protein
MGKPSDVCALTPAERHLIALLRQGPQLVTGVAEALCMSPEQTQDVFHSLHRKVGLVPLFRVGTLCYGLAE